MSKVKYTKELLTTIVKESLSVASVIRKLGLRQSGGTQSHISRKIKAYRIDISHFTGSCHNRGKISNKRKTAEDILIKREYGTRTKSILLRRSLVEIGIKYECSVCGINNWNDKQISLQVNHKNRDWLDDRKENLEFLCPNCHSQTEGWCGSKYEIDLFSNVNKSRRSRINKKLRRSSGGIADTMVLDAIESKIS
jgi:5-methylcytosine-specific restriction endonuclease McrA